MEGIFSQSIMPRSVDTQRYQVRLWKFAPAHQTVDAGFAPGENFHLALEYAHKLRLAGLSREDQLRQTLGYLRSLSKEKTT